jgi:hypothetical protein
LAIISKDYVIKNGDIICGDKRLKRVAVGRKINVGTPSAKNYIQFRSDTGNMDQVLINEMETKGAAIIQKIIGETKKSFDKGSSILLMKNSFLDDMKFKDSEALNFFAGNGKISKTTLESQIKKNMISWSFEPGNGEITVRGYQESLFPRMIMTYLGKTNHNMLSLYLTKEKDRMTFKTKIQNYSKAQAETLANILENSPSARKEFDIIAEKRSKEITLKVRLAVDEPGIINELFSILTKKGCLVSGIKSDETSTASKPLVTFKINYTGKSPESIIIDIKNKLTYRIKNVEVS